MHSNIIVQSFTVCSDQLCFRCVFSCMYYTVFIPFLSIYQSCSFYVQDKTLVQWTIEGLSQPNVHVTFRQFLFLHLVLNDNESPSLMLIHMTL